MLGILLFFTIFIFIFIIHHFYSRYKEKNTVIACWLGENGNWMAKTLDGNTYKHVIIIIDSNIKYSSHCLKHRSYWLNADNENCVNSTSLKEKLSCKISASLWHNNLWIHPKYKADIKLTCLRNPNSIKAVYKDVTDEM